MEEELKITIDALGNFEKPIRGLPVKEAAKQRHGMALFIPLIGSEITINAEQMTLHNNYPPQISAKFENNKLQFSR